MRALAIASTLLAGLAWGASPVSAHPERAQPEREPAEPESLAAGGALDYVIIPPMPKHRAAGIANTIYLNRCVGGCVVGIGSNDASKNLSTIATRQGRLSEFSSGDVAWSTLVQCVRRGYNQYAIDITTEEPAPGTKYVEVLVAGTPEQIGFPMGTLGIAPLTSDCSPVHNVLAFAFSEAHLNSTITELCATVIHEAGHAFGLDHALQCRDPMTYLQSCGERLFLNIESKCGEFRKSRNCRCGEVQNSHVKLLNELGPSGIVTPPTGNIILETLSQWDGSFVVGRIFETRWIRSVELWINGFRWDRLGHIGVIDVRFPPPPVSDGILDIELRSVNDLGGVSKASFTMTKGTPCQSTAACAFNEECREGRCMFVAPQGPVGMVCSEDSQCASWECRALEKGRRCVMPCSPGLRASECPEGFSCVSAEDPAPGICWPTEELPESGGCSSGAPAPLWPSFALVVLSWLGFRRRKK